jgi:hypothetical protein
MVADDSKYEKEAYEAINNIKFRDRADCLLLNLREYLHSCLSIGLENLTVDWV